MRFVSLFAGIGGGDLGFERAGHACVCRVESDPKCQRVLRAKSDAPVLGDIREVKSVPLDCDFFIVSDPCQGNTVVNSRISLDRSRYKRLWDEVFRLAETCSPDYIIRENPTMQRRDAVSSHESVALDLENLGYEVTIIDVQGGEVSGVSRQRTFVCAGIGQAGRHLREVLANRRCAKGDWPAHRSRAQPYSSLTCSHRRRNHEDNNITYGDGYTRVLSGRERLRAQGFPDDWLECLGSPGLTTVARMTGNAWPVFVAKWLGDRLTEASE